MPIRYTFPDGAKLCAARFTATSGFHYNAEDGKDAPRLRPANGLRDDASSGAMVIEQSAVSWQAFKGTRLAREVLAAHTPWLVQGPHEGLCLPLAACARAVTLLHDTAIGGDLYQIGAAVEEFALQSICAADGLHYAQLSSMGEEEASGIDIDGNIILPLTKVARDADSDAAAHACAEARGV